MDNNTEFQNVIHDKKLARKKKLLAVWDKCTTGLLIALMASPLLILLYIFLWFVGRNG